MARVTVEDCILKVPNRFDLVLLAAHRARAITAGSPLTVDRDRDKDPVVALREIAEATVPVAHLEEDLLKGLQKHVETEEPEDDEMQLLMSGEGLTGSRSEQERTAAELGIELESASAETADLGETSGEPEELDDEESSETEE